MPATPIKTGRRRPKASLIGPATTWPMASPIKHAVRVSWISDSLAARSRPIAGRAGRYISIESGPKAVSPPRRTNRRARPLRVMESAIKGWNRPIPELIPAASKLAVDGNDGASDGLGLVATEERDD